MAKNELLYRSAKVADIGYITVVYFILSFLVVLLIGIIPGSIGKDYSEELDKNKPTWELFLEVTLLMWLVGILNYFARDIMQNIPSPLNGIGGLDHSRVKEVDWSFVFLFIVLSFNNPLTGKLKLIFSRIMKK